eukprot:TRINITY_DN748_c0_g2_i1.p2 TRINITY_DN748_c0_g2~~TRINITY_DN748_c0_g2_i1.p2  ORF type:complete len:120 (-),score=7.15 TRINITY_DN748_c0_g2_i1:175-534(-)
MLCLGFKCGMKLFCIFFSSDLLLDVTIVVFIICLFMLMWRAKGFLPLFELDLLSDRFVLCRSGSRLGKYDLYELRSSFLVDLGVASFAKLLCVCLLLKESLLKFRCYSLMEECTMSRRL